MATTFEELQTPTPGRREDDAEKDDRSKRRSTTPSTDTVARRARCNGCYPGCYMTSYLVPLFEVDKCDDVVHKVKHYGFTVAGAQAMVLSAIGKLSD